MKKFIIIWKSKKTGKQVSLPVYAEEQSDAKNIADILTKASEDFYGKQSISFVSCEEVKSES